MPKKQHTEEPDYKERARIEAEAKHAALLADVVESHVPGYGRLPKKVGAITVKTGLSMGYRESEQTFELRLDSGTGDFVAIHGDRMYKSKSRDALKAKLTEIARVTLDLKWKRYIDITYKVTAKTGRDRSWHYSSAEEISIDERHAAKIEIVYGIELKWRLVEYSDEFELHGERFRMERPIDDDGKIDDRKQERVKPLLPSGLVEFTEARFELLKSIRAALTALDLRLADLFAGDTTQLAKQLDAIRDPSRLLGGGK